MSKLKLYQASNGYRYNSDSLIFYNFLSLYLKDAKILDVGCGCGILGLLIKKNFPNSHVSLVDIQEQNVFFALQNAKENNLKVDIFCEDFLNLNENEKFDFIISNPPFYHENVQKSEDLHMKISRYNLYLPFEKFATKSYKMLNPKGRFCFCYDAKQLSHVLCALKSSFFGIEILQFVHSKIDKPSKLCFIVAKKDFKGLCNILPPFITNDNEGFSLKTQEIFENTNTLSLS